MVAVVGGATAGAEIAARLSERGAEVVVFDQNLRPYGKIEDGLPRWHAALRSKEYNTINSKMTMPRVHFCPLTKLGKDISVKDLFEGWGFSAVIMANGAWRDRPLPVPDAEKYVGKGLVYQNQLIVWFNHLHDKAYQGTQYQVGDGIAVFGGGLASIDVLKLLSLGTVLNYLKKKGITPHLEELEQTGIPDWLKEHGMTVEETGLKGSTLYYRRRLEDMPLAEIPADATPEKKAKVEGARKKIVDKATEKFGFKLEPLCAPESLIIENDRVVGVRVARQKTVDGKPVPTGEVFEHRCAFVVGSIGSIPEPIEGIPMKGELFTFQDKETGRIPPYEHVFSTGNVVTGKGNIVASRKHAAALGAYMSEKYLGTIPGGVESVPVTGATETAAAVQGFLGTKPPLPGATADAIMGKVKARQTAVGYGDYNSWLAKHPPAPDEETH